MTLSCSTCRSRLKNVKELIEELDEADKASGKAMFPNVRSAWTNCNNRFKEAIDWREFVVEED